MLFWRGGLASSDFWSTGIDYWADHPIWPILIGIFLVAAVLAIRRYKIWPFIDRWAAFLILGSVMGTMVTAFVLYQYKQPSYVSPFEQQIVLYAAALKQIQATTPKFPTIQAPVDFQFLDKDRVEALYNQIEPDLVEEKRSVDTISDATAKAGVKVGIGEAELGGSKRQDANSTYQRVAFSPERQCVELMNFLLTHSQAQYYTDSRQWIDRQAAISFQQGLAQIQTDFEVKKKVAPVKPLPAEQPLGQPPTKEEQEAAQRQLKQYEDQFSAELSSLQGMVIVDGEFPASQSGEGSPVFVERFSDRPRHVDFRLTTPSTPELKQLASIGTTHLRVFGTILKPLGDDGVIEVRPIAIY